MATYNDDTDTNALPPKHEEAAIVLLEKAGNIPAAAQQLTMDRTTLWRWSKTQPFDRFYKMLRRESYLAAVTTLQVNARQAAQGLVDIMTSTGTTQQLKRQVCNDILALSERGLNFQDLNQRLEELEAT